MSFEAGKSKPVYFLHDLWKSSISTGATVEITIGDVIYLIRAYAMGADNCYIGYVERFMGRSLHGHCLFVRLPTAVWTQQSLYDVLSELIIELEETEDFDLKGKLTIRRDT
jgi:hypothetical protein